MFQLEIKEILQNIIEEEDKKTASWRSISWFIERKGYPIAQNDC
jgi:hypothetical protein